MAIQGFLAASQYDLFSTDPQQQIQDIVESLTSMMVQISKDSLFWRKYNFSEIPVQKSELSFNHLKEGMNQGVLTASVLTILPTKKEDLIT